jgi:hypothetical protein
MLARHATRILWFTGSILTLPIPAPTALTHFSAAQLEDAAALLAVVVAVCAAAREAKNARRREINCIVLGGV